MPVCIAGMHRSGTSMVARLLDACGVHLGVGDDLRTAGPDNPDGYWENAQFVGLNEEILAELGGAWDTPPALEEGWPCRPELTSVRFAATRLIDGLRPREPWGWKDPRNSLTLPFWISLIPDMKIVLCVRDPLEVAWSLRSRNFLSPLFGLNLWLAYNRAAVAALAPRNLLVTHYESYFHDPVSELGRLTEHLGVAVSREAMPLACSTVSSAARHHHASRQPRLEARTPPAALTLYRDLCARAGPVYEAVRSIEVAQGAAPGVEIAADSTWQQMWAHALQDRVTALWAQVGALSARTLKQEETIRALAEHVERSDRIIREMHATKLWRLGSRYWRARDGLKSIMAGAVGTRR
jgi:hypothetical protein